MFDSTTDLTLEQKFQHRGANRSNNLRFEGLFEKLSNQEEYKQKLEGICECCGTPFTIFNKVTQASYGLCLNCDGWFSKTYNKDLRQYNVIRNIINKHSTSFVFAEPIPLVELAFS